MDTVPGSFLLPLLAAVGCALFLMQCLGASMTTPLVILGAILAAVLVVSFTGLDVLLDAGATVPGLVFAGYLFWSSIATLLRRH